jgi:hypothetical protein
VNSFAVVTKTENVQLQPSSLFFKLDEVYVSLHCRLTFAFSRKSKLTEKPIDAAASLALAQGNYLTDD